MKARYLLAKFAPDINRMEPRNIGVIVWYRGAVAMKMLDASAADFVQDKGTYARWRALWEKTVAKDVLRSRLNGKVSRTAEGFLDAVRETQEGNYILVDAGLVTDKITKGDVPEVADFLFEELVLPPADATPVHKSNLNRLAEGLFDRVGILDRVQKRFAVDVPVYETRHRMSFSYGIGNGHPETLYQKAIVGNEPSVNDAAFKLRNAIDSLVVGRHRCAALINSAEYADMPAIYRERLAFLRATVPVIDLAYPEAAEVQIRETAGDAG